VIRVLVLDDDLVRLRAAARVFTREEGWDLAQVSTVEAAIGELRRRRYVLVSLDNDLDLEPRARGSGLDVAAYVAQDMAESERPYWVNVHSQNSGAARLMHRMLRGKVANLTVRRYVDRAPYWEVLAAKVKDRWLLS
jgi:hypothetical protein